MSNTEIIPGMNEEIEKLKAKNEAVSKVNMFLSIQWKELRTSQNLAEMSGLGMDVGTDIAIVNIANEYVKLKEENKALKEENEELKEEVEERTTYSVLPEEGKFMEENKKLREENKKLKEETD
jgi:regulator of replication initiation timing